MQTTPEHDQRIANLIFGKVYPYYVEKLEKKGRTKEELHEVIRWLTGFNETDIDNMIHNNVTFKEFFHHATLHPNAHLITGVICGYRVEEITTPLTKHIRYLDILVDKLAKRKAMNTILK